MRLDAEGVLASLNPALPRVLIVDDDEADLALTRRILDADMCELVCATSGTQALTLLCEIDAALVIVDVDMPQMDGLEFVGQVRANLMTRDLAIVLLAPEGTAAHDSARGYELGVLDYLFKPIDPNALRAKTRALLDLYIRRQELADARDALERSNSELQTAYRQLTVTQQQLIESAKMASMGTLVAGIAHELNTPLAYSMSHLATIERLLRSILLDRTAPSVDRQSTLLQERFRGLQIGLDRIRMLVVELQTFSRLDPGEYSSVNVAGCLSSVLAMLRPRFAGRIRVETRFDAPQYIRCNPQLFTQGVLNLLANGIDAIERQGTIQLACGADGSDYRIVVTDDGSGIPESIRHRVMEPFFTTRPVGKGSGLGLAITYALVSDHGGTLDLREAEAGGTEAVIRIPLSNLSQ